MKTIFLAILVLTVGFIAGCTKDKENIPPTQIVSKPAPEPAPEHVPEPAINGTYNGNLKEHYYVSYTSQSNIDTTLITLICKQISARQI